MTLASRRVALAVVALVGGSGVFAPANAQQPQEPAPPRIRVAVDIVPVDVQVLDRTGHPVPNLGPEKFTVTINGKRRRVVSAEQISSDKSDAEASLSGRPSAAVPSRVIMLAVDCISFDATASRDVIQSVAEFVRGLQPDDYVGLYAYPNGAQVTPTRDHAVVLRALNTVVGQRDGPGINQFNLRPTEVIDISRDISAGNGPTLERVAARECGPTAESGPTCRFRLATEVTNTALYYEGQATASLGMLRTLLTQMRAYPGRKTLLLVSGGMIISDTPGGRPDLGSLGLHVGREAAAANTAIYTVFIDTSLHDRFAAETRRAQRTSDSQARDNAVLVRWLEQFTGAAGGALFNVQVGNAEAALARMRIELSSYYLLGVEPAEEDRDGRTHEVAVKIRDSSLTIRGRRWVMIPKRDATLAAAPATAAPVPDAPPSLPDAPPPAPMPSNVAALAQVFERGNEAFQQALADTTDISAVIRGFRQSEGPWPENNRRTAVFALGLALAGLRSGMQDTRDDGGRLLAEYHVRVREPGGADAFECSWHVTEAAALEGLFKPEIALAFIPRALQRCPASGRLHLAYALVSEQQWVRGSATTGEDASSILSRYEQAMKFPETTAEARARGARFLLGLGEVERALDMSDGITDPPADLEIRYVAQLIRGQILRASGRIDEAAAAFRAALAAWPGAQSAQVALMTLLVQQGRREEAAALAEAVQTAPADQYDPWWMYWLGDYRMYPATIDNLRELAR
jgi:VWFA-related protein